MLNETFSVIFKHCILAKMEPTFNEFLIFCDFDHLLGYFFKYELTLQLMDLILILGKPLINVILVLAGNDHGRGVLVHSV